MHFILTSPLLCLNITLLIFIDREINKDLNHLNTQQKYTIKIRVEWAEWFLSILPALGKLRSHSEFFIRLNYNVRPCLKHTHTPAHAHRGRGKGNVFQMRVWDSLEL